MKVLLFRTLKMGKNFVIGRVLELLFLFHANSGATTQNRSSNLSYFKALSFVQYIICFLKNIKNMVPANRRGAICRP